MCLEGSGTEAYCSACKLHSRVGRPSLSGWLAYFALPRGHASPDIMQQQQIHTSRPTAQSDHSTNMNSSPPPRMHSTHMQSSSGHHHIASCCAWPTDPPDHPPSHTDDQSHDPPPQHPPPTTPSPCLEPPDPPSPHPPQRSPPHIPHMTRISHAYVGRLLSMS